MEPRGRGNDLDGRVALVFGAGRSSLLGHAIALGMARFGADLVVVDAEMESVEATAGEIRELGRKSIPIAADFSRGDEVVRAFSALDHRLGRLDVLVNSPGDLAGSSEDGTPPATGEEAAERLGASYRLACAQAGRRMIRHRRGGSIINVNGAAGDSHGARQGSARAALRASVERLSHDLAEQWAQHGIRVNTIEPSSVGSPVLQWLCPAPEAWSPGLAATTRLDFPAGSFRLLQDVARVAVFLASGAALHVTGMKVLVDAGDLLGARDADGPEALALESVRMKWRDA